MVFINSTETIGLIMAAGTTSLTGNITASLFLVFLILMAVALVFGIPLEFTAVIMLPLCLACGAHHSNFIGPLVIIILYVSTILAKNWIFR